MKTDTITYEEIEAYLNKKFKKEHTPKEILNYLNGSGYLEMSAVVREAKRLEKFLKTPRRKHERA